MSRQFVSQPLQAPAGMPAGAMEPALPPEFFWNGERIGVKTLRKQWRSTKEDRGDVYLKRHWFEFETDDGRIAEVYFDRAARSRQPHWWLYTITSSEER